VVYLDGKEQAAHTPVELPGLPKGKHVVRIALSGYHDHEREVVLDQHLKVVVTLAPDPSQTTQARPPTIVEPKPTGQLAVTSTPAGALVTTIDQDQKTTGWGNTPTTVTFPAPGRYTIRVALTRDNGSVTVERAVEIGTANQVMKIDLTAAVQIGPKK
jgi:hypothetical protein